VSTWRVHAFELEAMAADFPHARSLLVVRSQRTKKKSGESSTESRYYLSSRDAGQHTASQWLGLIRGHWGGVENRNHWRRDALMGEDRSRSRHATLLANVALLRNVLLAVMAAALAEQSLPELRERLHSHPARCLALLTES
jgi:predicted transposase YbfD/YdcC